MKKTILCLAFGFAAIGVANAAVLKFNNGAAGNAFGITDKDGNPFVAATNVGDALAGHGHVSAGEGVVAVGFFSSTVDFAKVSSTTDLLSLFTQMVQLDKNTGNPVDFHFGAGAPGGKRAQFAFTIDSMIAGTTLNGNNIYLLAGNASTLAASDQFLILKSDYIFDVAHDDIPTAQDMPLNPSNTQLMWGEIGPGFPTNTNDTDDTPSWRMAPLIPEPSVALLGGLSLLGLLRRRR